MSCGGQKEENEANEGLFFGRALAYKSDILGQYELFMMKLSQDNDPL